MGPEVGVRYGRGDVMVGRGGVRGIAAEALGVPLLLDRITFCRATAEPWRPGTEKVKGIVQRARSALTGGPVGDADHVEGDLEARVAIAGQGLRNIAGKRH